MDKKIPGDLLLLTQQYGGRVVGAHLNVYQADDAISIAQAILYFTALGYQVVSSVDYARSRQITRQAVYNAVFRDGSLYALSDGERGFGKPYYVAFKERKKACHE